MPSLLRSATSVAVALIFVATICSATLAAPAGSITGTVTDNAGKPVEGAIVAAYDWDTLAFKGQAQTTADGTYRIAGLPAGSYRVMATATGYLTQYWSGASVRQNAQMITVTDPGTVADIDFTLMPSSSILGHVYRDDGTTPISGAQVTAYESVTEPGTWRWMADAYTSADGVYKVTAAMGASNYLLMARAMGYAAEYYYNAATQEAATLVAVKAGKDTTGINFTLTRSGYISGTVYEADGVTPVGGATITARDSTAGGWKGYAHSSTGNGFYYINLPPGTYRLVAGAPGYVTEWYANAEAFDTATPVTVVGVNEKPNINFTLTACLAVTTTDATNLTANSARLNGDLASLGTIGAVTVSFEWGTTAHGPYPNSTNPETKTSKGAFYATLEGLDSGTTYYYRAKAVGGGDPVYGEEKRFTTATIDNAAPLISLVSSDDATGSGITISWVTHEPATSQVEYGLTEQYGSVTPLDTNLVVSHKVDLAGLKPGKTYHYRVISRDASNNESVSPDFTLETTGRASGTQVWAWLIIGLIAIAAVAGVVYTVKVKGKPTKQ
ncbi:MAG: carboxypeptidase regulatory-like domain-containing protein [Dehalococcoidia bacterium]|nr:carboxypeptidase regulatory-like domain-containing protein [Dehalococcoidia bacterium]